MSAIPTKHSNPSTDNSGSASPNASLPTSSVVVIAVWAALALTAILYGVFSCWRRGRARRRAAAQAERFSPPPSYRERSSRKGATSPSASDTALDLEAQAPELAYAPRARTSPARSTSPPNANVGQNYGAALPNSPPVPVTYQGFRDLSPFGVFVEPPAPARMRSDK